MQNIVKDLQANNTKLSVFLLGNQGNENVNLFWYELDINTTIYTCLEELDQEYV